MLFEEVIFTGICRSFLEFLSETLTKYMSLKYKKKG